LSKPPKIDRKQLKQADGFVTRGRNAVAWVAGSRVRVIPLLLLALGMGLAWNGYQWWQTGRLEESWDHFARAFRLPEPQRTEDLKTVYARFRSSRPGYFAALALADHFFEEARKEKLKDPSTGDANAAQAVEWYRSATVFKGLLSTETQLLHVDIGAALELRGKLDEAMGEYRMAADVAGGDGKPLALLGIGRVHELKGERDKAIEAYERITVDFATSEYARHARNLLRRLKSPLFGAPAAKTG